MIVFGGYDNAGSSCADVWTLDLSDVPQWRPFGLAETRPQRRAAHHAIYDPVGDRMLVFGSFAWANDLWELPLSAPAWRQLFPGGTAPSGRTLSATIYDPLRKRLLLFGGLGATGALNDLWALSLEGPLAWTKLTPSGVAPGPRVGQTAVYDAPLDRMLVFGGAPALSSPAQSDVWELSLSGPPSWRELAVAGTPPPARIGGTLVLDPIRDRLILFGGGDSAYIPFDGRASLRNDLWQLSLSDMRWSELTPLGEIPGPRYGHSAVYDPVRDRMVVFAGTTQGLNDRLYALELSGVPTWSRLTASGADPREHTFHTAVYDPLRDRMLVFGGWDWSQFGYALDGTWALTWGNAPPPPPPPVPPQAAANPINVRSYPNPARGTVTFEIEVLPPVPEDVELRIYDASGRLLRVITSRIPSGCHTVQWDRTGNGGERLDPGIYFYVFRAGATRMTRRLVILE